MRAKGLLVLGLAAVAAISQAQLIVTNVDATVTFDDSAEFDLAFNQNGFELDFSAGTMPMLVASRNSEFESAIVRISYDVEAPTPITGLELIFSGWVFGDGTLAYQEAVFDGEGNMLASVDGSFDGDLPFTQTDFLAFRGQDGVHVEKVFILDLGRGGNERGLDGGGGISLASLGLVEQNVVPEPATMGALALGAVGLLARRRRR